jgi:hypothetical protein
MSQPASKPIEPKDNITPFPRRKKIIDWSNDEDVRGVVLAAMGYSDACIARYTALSTGQIQYRIRKAGATGVRKAFRNGEGRVAEYVLHKVSAQVQAQVEAKLPKANLAKQITAGGSKWK